MALPRKSDGLPRIPRRRSSGTSSEIEAESLETMMDVLSSLPDEALECLAAERQSSRGFGEEEEVELSMLESSGSSVGRWSSSSSLDYFHQPEEEEAASAGDRSSSRPKRRVRFNAVQVREYAICEGDHPHCRTPISLDWQHTDTETKHIETYEGIKVLTRKQQRQPTTAPPKRLSLQQREQRILQATTTTTTQEVAGDDEKPESWQSPPSPRHTED